MLIFGDFYMGRGKYLISHIPDRYVRLAGNLQPLPRLEKQDTEDYAGH